MDDIQEQNELSEEITNALSNPVGFGQDVDEVGIGGDGGMIGV